MKTESDTEMQPVDPYSTPNTDPIGKAEVIGIISGQKGTEWPEISFRTRNQEHGNQIRKIGKELRKAGLKPEMVMASLSDKWRGYYTNIASVNGNDLIAAMDADPALLEPYQDKVRAEYERTVRGMRVAPHVAPTRQEAVVERFTKTLAEPLELDGMVLPLKLQDAALLKKLRWFCDERPGAIAITLERSDSRNNIVSIDATTKNAARSLGLMLGSPDPVTQVEGAELDRLRELCMAHHDMAKLYESEIGHAVSTKLNGVSTEMVQPDNTPKIG